MEAAQAAQAVFCGKNGNTCGTMAPEVVEHNVRGVPRRFQVNGNPMLTRPGAWKFGGEASHRLLNEDTKVSMGPAVRAHPRPFPRLGAGCLSNEALRAQPLRLVTRQRIRAAHDMTPSALAGRPFARRRERIFGRLHSRSGWTAAEAGDKGPAGEHGGERHALLRATTAPPPRCCPARAGY